MYIEQHVVPVHSLRTDNTVHGAWLITTLCMTGADNEPVQCALQEMITTLFVTRADNNLMCCIAEAGNNFVQ